VCHAPLAPVKRGALARAGSERRSCCHVRCAAVLHTVLALSLDPRDLLDSLSPYGEIGLAAIVFAETGLLIGFFLPGDSLLLIAGILASDGHFDLGLAIPLCFVGAFLGSEVGYFIGVRLGPRIFTRKDSRFFKQDYVERTHGFFERHGPKTVVLARFVPIVRTFTPVMAGVGSMRHRVYMVFNLIGALLWAVGVLLVGYALGDAIGNVSEVELLPIIAVVVLISFIPALIEWRRSRAKRATDV
jgi:membrane-associated protein